MSPDKGSPQSKGARRLLTVLFSDLTDSTGLVAGMVSEDYADLIGRLKQIFTGVIPQHGGHVVQVQGDGVLAVFGLEAREDESRHAVEAALDLHAAVGGISHPFNKGQNLSLHSGIHSGLVLMVEGDDVAGSYVLAGDAPHIASRLSGLCEADEILVSEDSLGSDRHFFKVSALQHLELKSLSSTLPVYLVGGRTGVDTRFEARRRRGLTALIGRDRDLGFLRSTFESAAQNLQRVRVTGPAGMGKTRLVEEFLQSLDETPAVVLSCYCERQPKEALLQPALDMLRQLCGIDANTHAEIFATDLAELRRFTPGLDAHQAILLQALNQQGAEESALLQTLCQVFLDVTQERQLVLFFDDWQWVDDATRHFYTSLAEHRDRSILMISCARSGTPAVVDDGATVLDIQPLLPERAREVIAALLPGADPFLTDRIARASGGNVLYLEELCHSVNFVSDNAAAAVPEQPDAGRLPNYLKMLVESRVAELPREQQHVLRCAAVIGNVVPRWLLAEITDDAVTDAMVAELESRDLLYAEQGAQVLRFKHGLTRDVVVDEVGLHERRGLHELIAQALEARHEGGSLDAIVAMLAYHYSESADFEKAAFYAESAGDKAMDAAALDRASAHYQSALQALDKFTEDEARYQRWISIAQRLAMACLYDARHSQLPIYQQALKLATARDDMASAAEAEYRLAYINYSLGEGPAAVRHCESAVERVSLLNSPPFALQLEATLGQTLAINGRYAEALPLLDSAIEQQRPYKTRARIAPAFAYTLAARGMVLGDQGLFDEAYACFDEADELISGSSHQIRVSAASMRGGVYVWQGRWEEAMACAEQTIEIANHIGSRYMYAIGVAMKGYCMWRLDLERGAVQLQQGIALLEHNDQALWTSLHHSWHAEVLGELQDFETMRLAVARTFLRSRKGERLGDATAYSVLAMAPDDYRRHAPEYYFDKALNTAIQRESPRERAVVELVKAQHLHTQAAQREHGMPTVDSRPLVESSARFFADHQMHWHAARAQELL